jgi:hypothetical protein
MALCGDGQRGAIVFAGDFVGRRPCLARQTAELVRVELPPIAAADIAAEPHLSVGLGECAEGEGAMQPGFHHAARLEPASGQ